jgi:hypothetical protein
MFRSLSDIHNFLPTYFKKSPEWSMKAQISFFSNRILILLFCLGGVVGFDILWQSVYADATAQNLWQQINESYGGGVLQRIQPASGISAPISFGQTLCDAISSPAEIDSYTFLASAGDKVLVRMSRASGSVWAGIKVVSPGGVTLRQVANSPTAEIDTLTLPSNGTYTILAFDGFNGTLTGDYCLFLQRLNNPGSAKPINFGQTATTSISNPAEMDTYTFSVAAGDRVLLRMSRAAGSVWKPILSTPNPATWCWSG